MTNRPSAGGSWREGIRPESEAFFVDRHDVHRAFAAAEGDRQAETVGDAQRTVHEQRGHFGRAQFAHGRSKQRQPAPEMFFGKPRYGQMRRQGPAVVAPGPEQRRRPEVAHLGQVVRPRVWRDPAVEDRTEKVVGAYPVVKTM